jgi:hypothetical protein
MPGMTSMVTVVLKQPWTDSAGIGHPPGSTVRVPETALDDLVSAGLVVTHPTETWVTCE